MKKLIIILLLTSFAGKLHAQTFREWFRQKKTQKKYLIQQIAALQVYLGYVNKGYSIVQKGLTTISDLKKAELNLHTNYFSSLKNVNPNIKSYAKVADIIILQKNIIETCKHDFDKIRESKAFNPGEADYIHRVFSRLLDDCASSIDELIALTTDGKLEMKDDERLRRIDELYTNVQDNYSFMKGFCKETVLLAANRTLDKNDIQTSRAFYGIKNQLP